MMQRFLHTKPFQDFNRAIATFLQPKRLAILEACLIGLVCGVAAVLLKQGAGWLGTWRIYTSVHGPSWLWLPIVGFLGGVLAGALVEGFAPETSGSGIPNVKAALAGVNISLDGRVAVVKLISSMFAIGSGLTLGRQGPTVQIGAALAAQLSNWFPTSPDYRRQLIAAGAAAGLAAGFNAPLAGVLFAVEELLYDISGFTLGPAIIASFIGAVVSRILGGQSLDLNLKLTTFDTSFSAQEIPFYLVLGILAGLLGTLFTQAILAIISFNRRVLRLSLPLRVGIAGLICGLVVAMLPPFFRNNSGLREFLIAGHPGAQASAIVFVTHFLLSAIAAGSGAPGGLFAPSLVLGSSLGYLVGVWQVAISGVGSPVTYALAGMGAFFCSVSRAPITGVVMIFEISTDFNLVLPLMVASVVSYLVAQRAAAGSLYDRLLELSNIQIKKENVENGFLSNLKALDVMQRRVETLTSEMTLDEVVDAFSRSHHRGFPVLERGRFVGIVTQTDLSQSAQRNLPGETQLKDIMTPEPVTVSPSDTLIEVLYRLNRFNLSRLPVTEHRKLVGIITRSDIIRAESEQLTGKNTIGRHPEPSYVVYQTRSPATGRGRLLVPLANPQTAPALLRLAAAIARERHYELECLHTISVSRHRAPNETPVRTTSARRLLRQAERVGRDWEVPVHTQIRVAHDAAQAMLETIKERHIDLMLMGWKGTTSTPGRIFGNVADTVIRQAACDVLLVKLATGDERRLASQKAWKRESSPRQKRHRFPHVPSHLHLPASLHPHTEDLREIGFPISSTVEESQLPILNLQFNRWLVPIRGGPSAIATVKLLPDLMAIAGDPEIFLCQVFGPDIPTPDPTVLNRACDILDRKIKGNIICTSVCAKSVPDALIDLADKDQCDVIVLGASREGMLQQVMTGNIPEAIARSCDCTVILVRSALAS